jgi:hypothetical protein
MKELVRTVFALAGHSMPHRADRRASIPKFITKIYTAGNKACSAHGLGALHPRRGAAGRLAILRACSVC